MEEFPEAEKIFQEADQVIPDFSIRRLCLEGPEEKLRLTRYTQPAVFTVSMASYEAAKKFELFPGYAAGHSVGEYGALAAAGVFPFAQGLQLVKKRGELMQEAGEKYPGGMTAILGLPASQVEEVCRDVFQAIGKIVEVANLNSPSQVVISGNPDAVRKAEELARARGAKRVIPLPVSGAFHSPLMKEAAEKMAVELDRIEFHDPLFPVISNVTGRPVSHGEEIRNLMKRQMREKVLWEESVRFLIEQGVHVFFEMEPGNALSGLVRSVSKSVKVFRFDEYQRSDGDGPHRDSPKGVQISSP